MTDSSRGRRVMIIAGEASGDQHGAHLVKALRRRRPRTEFFGVGGDALRQAGVEIAVDASQLSVVGITEVLAKLPGLRAGLSACRRLLVDRRPDLLVLVDFPDFNLHVAGIARRLGIRVLYYISPQLWAWRPGRVHKIGRRVDHMAVILPFEEAFYRRHAVPVTFVGHPLMDVVAAPPPRPAEADDPVVGLLPGSRDSEIARHLPVLLATVQRLQTRVPAARFLLSLAPTVDPGLVDQVRARVPVTDRLETVTTGVEEIFRRATLVVAASGTVTLQAAIAGVPLVVFYRLSTLTYLLGRTFIRVPHVSLVNLIAGRRLVPELIQRDATPGRLCAAVEKLLADPRQMAAMRAGLRTVHRRLGGAGASERTAEIADNLMRGRYRCRF